MNILSEYFPYINEGFIAVKDIIRKNRGNQKLAPSEIDRINYHMLTFLASGYTFFDNSKANDIVSLIGLCMQIKRVAAIDQVID